MGFVESDRSELEKKFKEVRMCLHQVSGHLTAVSMGLYCVKSAENLDAATKYIDDMQSILDEAGSNLITVRKSIIELENEVVEQK